MAKLLSGTRIYGNLLIDTNVAILGSNISSSTTTGALTVAGGAGIAGNVFVGNVLASGFFYANGTPFVSSSYGNATVASYLPTYTGSLAASADIVTLTANAGAQANQIAGANAAIVTANTALKAYTDAQITTTQSWVTGANAAIVTANTAMKSYVDTQDSAITTAWTSNAGAQANQIAGANAAIVTANTALKAYTDAQITTTQSWVTGANASVITANTALKGYVDAQITNLTNGAPGILDTLGEIATSLGNNASLSTTLLNAIAGSNAAIVTANTALKAYTDAQITTTQSWVTGANAAIVTANTALKSYVDTQDTSITSAWTSNAGAQANQITGANTVVATLQANVGSFYTYANTKIGTNTNSNLVVVATTTSTSTTTGALVVAGGVGVAGNVYVAGSLVTSGASGNISGVSTLIATTVNAATIGNTNAVHTGSTGTFTSWANVTGTATSTSTTTGALVVAGGAGIAGNITTANVFATGVYIGSGSAISGLFWSANNAAVSGGVTYTSTGAGNITVYGSTLALTTTGPGAVTTGNSTAIPVITTDAYGRISSISTSTVSTTISLAGTSGTGSVAGGGTLTFAGSNGMTATASGSTITISTPQDLQTTALPTFANVTVANIIINTGGKRNGRNIVTNYSGNTAPVTPLAGDEWFRGNTGVLYKYVFDNVTSTNNWIDISSALYNANTAAVANTIALRDSGGNLTATNFLGIASSAKYADLAEMYTADDDYGPATVVVFGGAAEITVTTESHDSRVAGVISTNPAYLMNSELPNGLPVAFTGRVPCLVQGPVDKGDLLVTSTTPGVAQRLDNSLFKPGCVVGKSLGSIQNDEVATIEVAVGRY